MASNRYLQKRQPEEDDDDDERTTTSSATSTTTSSTTTSSSTSAPAPESIKTVTVTDIVSQATPTSTTLSVSSLSTSPSTSLSTPLSTSLSAAVTPKITSPAATALPVSSGNRTSNATSTAAPVEKTSSTHIAAAIILPVLLIIALVLGTMAFVKRASVVAFFKRKMNRDSGSDSDSDFGETRNKIWNGPTKTMRLERDTFGRFSPTRIRSDSSMSQVGPGPSFAGNNDTDPMSYQNKPLPIPAIYVPPDQRSGRASSPTLKQPIPNGQPQTPRSMDEEVQDPQQRRAVDSIVNNYGARHPSSFFTNTTFSTDSWPLGARGSREIQAAYERQPPPGPPRERYPDPEDVENGPVQRTRSF